MQWSDDSINVVFALLQINGELVPSKSGASKVYKRIWMCHPIWIQCEHRAMRCERRLWLWGCCVFICILLALLLQALGCQMREPGI